MTVGGVMCTYDLKGFQKFEKLKILQAMQEKREQLAECLRLHENERFFCEPGYQAPVPGLEFENG